MASWNSEGDGDFLDWDSEGIGRAGGGGGDSVWDLKRMGGGGGFSFEFPE